MKYTAAVISALAAALTLSAVAANAGPAATPSYESEKCYGVAAKGKNDCQTAQHACAGMSKMTKDANSWIYVPAGTCAKIAGGKMKSA